MNEDKLEKLFKYLELLTGAYFTDDSLNVKPSVERVIHLIELELNEMYEGEEKDASQNKIT